jgi:hypothetical protein
MTITVPFRVLRPLVPLLLLPLAGCLVVTLHPVYDKATVEFDEALVGTWVNSEEGHALTIAHGAWKAYDVSSDDDGDVMRFTGHLTTIASRPVLDLTREAGQDSPPGTVRVHLPFLVERQGDTLVLRPLNHEWFKARAGRPETAGVGASLDSEDNVLLARPTPEVRSWLAAHMTTAGVWDEGTTFRRKPPVAGTPPAVPRETESILERHEADDYTRYELLAPATATFRITYDVTATQAGARHYFNVIRKGSAASDEAVFDQATGLPLPFKVVSGADARQAGYAAADLDAQYIQVTLRGPVPAGGETRLRIDKTYRDAVSYFREGDLIVFSRELGIRRNAVVLPAGYEVVACNVPSQIASEQDGRVRVSFMHTGAGAVPLVIKARALPQAPAAASAATAAPAEPVRAGAALPAPQSPSSRLAERAKQDREIVYFLQQPETHAFALYHDYTERRPGIDTYLNVVRTGSRVSNPSARLLDTGEALAVETLKGAAITEAKLHIGEQVQPDTEVVVIRFPAVKAGQSARLRIIETYTDDSRYYLDGDELVWDRSLGRSRNAVVLPSGWYLTATSIPAVVTMTADGRVRLDYDNGRPDEVAVLLKAKRRNRP